MVNYYGIGHWYDKINILDYVINNGVACISSRTEPYNERRKNFIKLIQSINKGDIIFLKSYNLGKNLLLVKATGEATKEEKRKIPKINNITNPGHWVTVKWDDDNFNSNALIELPIDNRGERHFRIYQETDSDIIKEIEKLRQKYRNDYSKKND